MKLKKILTAALCMTMACSISLFAAGCGVVYVPDATPVNTDEYIIPQDNCRTYYEVFVRSFADGNGDGIGDLRGLADNLDYLNDGDDSTTEDLGINGIWMMPINSSGSYHKYDVDDYYNIDDEYGTLEDFDYLVSECNKRGIWLQMDLVINHTSGAHPWFQAAVAAAKRGASINTDPALGRYRIVQSNTTPVSPNNDGHWYQISGTNYYYYSYFSSTMPELQLAYYDSDNHFESLNEDLCEELYDIADFWIERGVHSFRLDAARWACDDVAGSYDEGNKQFWTAFNEHCHQKGAEVFAEDFPDNDVYCYNVAEVWGDNSTVVDFFDSGMSNFNYAMGGDYNVGFAAVANGSSNAASHVRNLAKHQSDILAKDEHAIMSNFLSNHDNSRSAGFFGRDAKRIKAAAALYLLSPGNPYIYYGEEIGTIGTRPPDENVRLAFNWGDSRTVKNPTGATWKDGQTFGSVADQTEDYYSILTYYRNAIKFRNRFPEIGRGTITQYGINASGNIATAADILSTISSQNLAAANELNYKMALYKLTWNGRDVIIVHCLNDSAVSLGTSAISGYSLVGSLTADRGTVTLEDGTLKMPAYSVAVLKQVPQEQ